MVRDLCHSILRAKLLRNDSTLARTVRICISAIKVLVFDPRVFSGLQHIDLLSKWLGVLVTMNGHCLVKTIVIPALSHHL